MVLNCVVNVVALYFKVSLLQCNYTVKLTWTLCDTVTVCNKDTEK